MPPKIKKIKKANWCQCSTDVFVKIWGEKAKELRSVRKTSIIHQQMADALSIVGFEFNKDEIKRKVNNMSMRYKKEKADKEPSTWRYFDIIQDILNGKNANYNKLKWPPKPVETPTVLMNSNEGASTATAMNSAPSVAETAQPAPKPPIISKYDDKMLAMVDTIQASFAKVEHLVPSKNGNPLMLQNLLKEMQQIKEMLANLMNK